MRWRIFTTGFDGFMHLVIGDRVEKAETEVFEFSTDFAHAEAVRNRGVDIQSFFRDLVLAVFGEMLQCSHVVQAVCKLDHDDANVVHHRQHHLAQVLGLLLFARSEINLADLRNTFDDVRDLLAEFHADIGDGDRRVLDGVMQQAGSDRNRVHAHFGQDAGHLQRMHKVRLARGAALAGMVL